MLLLSTKEALAMERRINYAQVAPEPVKTLVEIERYLGRCGLERPLLELVKLRASQINGCAYCIDMHTKDARAAGETEQRLYGLNAWRETPFYTDRERAALEWVEAITLVSQNHVPDDLFARTREVFNEKELTDLTWAAVAINAWNRIAITFRPVPGGYQPPKTH
jgi:AhpD family alkylhydroperoxidase